MNDYQDSYLNIKKQVGFPQKTSSTDRMNLIPTLHERKGFFSRSRITDSYNNRLNPSFI
jgi:hypothetical protein